MAGRCCGVTDGLTGSDSTLSGGLCAVTGSGRELWLISNNRGFYVLTRRSCSLAGRCCGVTDGLTGSDSTLSGGLCAVTGRGRELWRLISNNRGFYVLTRRSCSLAGRCCGGLTGSDRCCTLSGGLCAVTGSGRELWRLISNNRGFYVLTRRSCSLAGRCCGVTDGLTGSNRRCCTLSWWAVCWWAVCCHW